MFQKAREGYLGFAGGFLEPIPQGMSPEEAREHRRKASELVLEANHNFMDEPMAGGNGIRESLDGH